MFQEKKRKWGRISSAHKEQDRTSAPICTLLAEKDCKSSKHGCQKHPSEQRTSAPQLLCSPRGEPGKLSTTPRLFLAAQGQQQHSRDYSNLDLLRKGHVAHDISQIPKTLLLCNRNNQTGQFFHDLFVVVFLKC